MCRPTWTFHSTLKLQATADRTNFLNPSTKWNFGLIGTFKPFGKQRTDKTKKEQAIFPSIWMELTWTRLWKVLPKIFPHLTWPKGHRATQCSMWQHWLANNFNGETHLQSNVSTFDIQILATPSTLISMPPPSPNLTGTWEKCFPPSPFFCPGSPSDTRVEVLR